MTPSTGKLQTACDYAAIEIETTLKHFPVNEQALAHLLKAAKALRKAAIETEALLEKAEAA